MFLPLCYLPLKMCILLFLMEKKNKIKETRDGKTAYFLHFDQLKSTLQFFSPKILVLNCFENCKKQTNKKKGTEQQQLLNEKHFLTKYIQHALPRDIITCADGRLCRFTSDLNGLKADKVFH